jgi:hypothetical protein
MLLAFVWTVCAKVATFMVSLIEEAEQVRALANLGQANTGMTMSCRVDERVVVPRGRVYKSMVGSLQPRSISVPLK